MAEFYCRRCGLPVRVIAADLVAAARNEGFKVASVEHLVEPLPPVYVAHEPEPMTGDQLLALLVQHTGQHGRALQLLLPAMRGVAEAFVPILDGVLGVCEAVVARVVKTDATLAALEKLKMCRESAVRGLKDYVERSNGIPVASPSSQSPSSDAASGSPTSHG